MKKIYLLGMLWIAPFSIHAQVGVGTTTPDAQLDIRSSNQATPSSTDGILIPKIDAFPAANPTAAQQGMLVYLTTAAGPNPPGFYFWNNPTTSWQPLKGADGGTLDQAYDFGGAGVGRTITADAGAVTINGNDGFIATGTFGSGATIPVLSGPRMIWNPRKGAFRAGHSSSTSWDEANTGDYSLAAGLATRASGVMATALGNTTTASGIAAMAFGSHTVASANTATAFGFSTVASADRSTAFGVFSTASGNNSFASGVANTAPSYGETILGIGATDYTPSTNGASQFRAANATDRLLAVGNAIDANDDDVINLTERSDALIILKNGLTRLPSTTNAMIDAADGKAIVTKEYLQGNTSGTLDQAYDFGGAGAGRTITADTGAVTIDGTDGLVSTGTFNSGAQAPTGDGIRMVWNPRRAAFRAGIVFGTAWDDVNIGNYSTAFGNNTRASGQTSTAFGSGSTALGAASTAFGVNTVATGNFTTVFGINNAAPSYGETTFGLGATTYATSVNGASQFRAANATDRLFVVGNALDLNNNGSIDFAERSDGLIMLKNGLTRLPSMTNALIDAADGKAIVTKEYLQGNTSGTLDQAYDFGGAGAGRTITADTGAVTINGTDGLVSTGTFNTGALVPSGAGVRMVWNPRRCAFRAGRVTGAQWDDANVGFYSFSAGYDNIALGPAAISLGYACDATSQGAFAVGGENNANAYYTVAAGWRNNANGFTSSVFGAGSTAHSYGETVLGIGATNYVASAGGDLSFGVANNNDRLFTIGNAVDVNNNNQVELFERSDALIMLKTGLTRLPSTTNAMIDAADGKAIVTKEYLQGNTSGTLDQAYDFGGAGAGRNITADTGAVLVSGNDGLQVTGTFGSGATIDLAGAGTKMFFNPRKAAFRAGRALTANWDDANVGNYSMALGINTLASGYTTFAGGYYTEATASYATAMGFQSVASGNTSSAFGSGTLASGSGSTAMGVNTTASGNYSTATGFATTAAGIYAIATGINSTANNSASTAMGNDTTASGNASTAMGHNHTAYSFGETVVGIGATVYTPSVNGATQFRLANGTDRIFVVGNAADTNNNSVVDAAERRDALVVLKNGRTGLGTATPLGQFELTVDQGRKPGTSTWTIVSDARLKNVTGDFTAGLEEIKQLRPVRYRYKNAGARTFDQQVLDTEFGGFLAQDVQRIFPNCVGTDDDGYLNLNINDILVASVNAVKQLDAQNKTLQTELDELKKIVEALSERIKTVENK
ncbi:tail fiber domain-containing protein [Flavobacterium caeni]|uniref:Head domain of trimeric autotransporter adhesin n=1 Tax=Flavobacterium caeni TaxID=490189 RepID=A0A1G5FF19_9FLAO|nr:tail fiber domain-containing protein [Flavobacterium caeni]SCY37238.1 Head domain of trimeric autotransporter adhesin [Flavobacterium caeni]